MSRLSLALALLAGCAPSSQIVLHVDTDAPVPQLFDRLRIQLERGGVALASRDFTVDAALFAAGRASIGAALPEGDGNVVARVQLFRGDRTIDGAPPPATTLTTVVALPPLGHDGTRDVTVRLHTDDVGQPQGSVEGPIAPDPGAPGDSMVNSWPGGLPIDCAGAAGPGEVCIPGGAYLMGDPLVRNNALGTDANVERLVVISPFFLDTREVTVADFRAHGDAAGALASNNLVRWNGTNDPLLVSTTCTYSDGPKPTDPADAHAALSLDCVTYNTAAAYCATLGKRLPTEAEFEFVASGRGEERGFVWGGDDPACADAVWGRGGAGLKVSYVNRCLPPGQIGDPLPPGSGVRDRLTLTGGEVVDLAGNLAEWALDRWSRQDEPFWSRTGVFRDPIADLRSIDGLERTVRGGWWYVGPIGLRAATRQHQAAGFASDAIGFRCARPGR